MNGHMGLELITHGIEESPQYSFGKRNEKLSPIRWANGRVLLDSLFAVQEARADSQVSELDGYAQSQCAQKKQGHRAHFISTVGKFEKQPETSCSFSGGGSVFMVVFHYVLHFDIGLFCAPECFVQGNFLESVFLIDVYGGLERATRDQR